MKRTGLFLVAALMLFAAFLMQRAAEAGAQDPSGRLLNPTSGYHMSDECYYGSMDGHEAKFEDTDGDGSIDKITIDSDDDGFGDPGDDEFEWEDPPGVYGWSYTLEITWAAFNPNGGVDFTYETNATNPPVSKNGVAGPTP